MSLPQIDRDFGLEAKLPAIKLSAIPLTQAMRISPKLAKIAAYNASLATGFRAIVEAKRCRAALRFVQTIAGCEAALWRISSAC